MRVDRLIGIIAVLRRQGKATMPELAERFEVSRRTISRDIDAICRAGIPVVTRQGEGGGVSLMEGCAVDATVFTRDELAAILTGIRGLQSVAAAPDAAGIAGKLGGERAEDGIEIDLASFYKDDLADKIRRIRQAIREGRQVKFRYYSKKGEEDRRVEPHSVVYQWADWYVFGFCAARQDFRLFKLRRLWELEVLEERFEKRAAPEEKKRFGSNMTDDYMIEAIYEPSVKYRLIEEYGPDSFRATEDGRLYARWGFSSAEQAVEWFLSFSDRVRVIGPEEMVERMRRETARIAKLYE